MKIKNYLYILPLLSLLGSCSNPNYSYSFSINDINKANINRNLDINGTSYETGLVYEDGNQIASRLKNNEDALLFLHQSSCDHCKDLEPTFMEMVNRFQIRINAFIDIEIRSGAEQLKSNLDYGEELFSRLATPTLYLLNKDKGSKIDLTGTYFDEEKLTKTIGTYINLTNIYTSSINLDFSNDGLYLLYKNEIPSIYYSSILEKANKSNKDTYLFDVANLSEKELQNRFNINVTDYSILIKENGDIKNPSKDEMEGSISTYYVA